MNLNTQTPEYLSGGLHPCSLPIEWGSGVCLPNNPKPRWYWTPGVAAGKGRRWGKLPPAVALWLTPEESAGQRLWRDRGISTDSEHNQVGETRGNRHSLHQIPHMFSGIFTYGSGGSPGYGVGLWLKLILFIITFDLIIAKSNNNTLSKYEVKGKYVTIIKL